MNAMADNPLQPLGSAVLRVSSIDNVAPRRPERLLIVTCHRNANREPREQFADRAQRRWRGGDEGPIELPPDLVEVDVDRHARRGKNFGVGSE